MGMDVGGPSSSNLANRVGAHGTPPNTGLGMGAELVDKELGFRQHYAQPMQGNDPIALSSGRDPGSRNPDAPDYYNYGGGLPVKYSVPTAQKERLVARQAIREAAAAAPPDSTGNLMRTDPITDEEVSYLQSMKDQAELADFDTYVNTLIDPRKPGNLKWLMEIYPEYVDRRIQQVHTDYEYALRNQMIDSWGINTFDDLHFKYLVDQGKIKGPNLTEYVNTNAFYAPGMLSPLAWSGDTRPKGLRLPFASAKFGRRPGDDPEAAAKWEINNGNNPLSTGRKLNQMAAGMYGIEPNNVQGYGGETSAFSTQNGTFDGAARLRQALGRTP